MAVRNHHSRTSNNYTEVAGKLFFNKSHSSVASMRQAAKRFVATPDFTDNCMYYDGYIVDGRWKFKPVGNKLR